MNTKTHEGYTLAMIASGLLLTDVLLLVGTFGVVLYHTVGESASLQVMASTTPLPFFAYAIWALAVFGTAAAIAAIALYGFRARWFWRCLMVAAILWLLFPPVHMVIGLISLILLIAYRKSFPLEREPVAVAP